MTFIFIQKLLITALVPATVSMVVAFVLLEALLLAVAMFHLHAEPSAINAIWRNLINLMISVLSVSIHWSRRRADIL